MKKSNVFLQSELSSCGACCVASIVSYYGGYVPLETILIDTRTDKNGTNALELVECLKKYGFNSYGLKTSLEDIKTLTLPVIAHTVIDGYEHFIVIYEDKGDKLIVMDPRCGKTTYSIEEFKKYFDNIVIYAIPNESIVKYETSTSLWKLISDIIFALKSKIHLLLVITILIVILSMLTNLYVKLGEKSTNITSLTILMMSLLCLKYTLMLYQNKQELNLSKKIGQKLNSTFISHIFHLDRKYLHNKRVGEIDKKISDMEIIKTTILNLFLKAPLNLIIFIIGLIISVFISLKLSLITLIIILITSCYTLLKSKKIYNMELNRTTEYTNYSGTLMEYLEGLDSIKNLNKENYFLDNLSNTYDNYLNVLISTLRYQNKTDIVINFILEIGYLLIIFYGLSLVKTGISSFYDLIAFTTIYSLLNSTFASFLDTFINWHRTKAIFIGISEFLDIKEESIRKEESIDTLELKDISVSYNRLDYQLKNISLTIKKGDKILITGPSGIGKSTLVKCLSGGINDYLGEIIINNRSNILDNFKKNILYIGQNEKIFTRSIKDNICLGNYDKKLFDYTIKMTCLDEVIEKRKDKENTPILEGGTNLSAGEKARLILGRALYLKPSVLIIDETLSNVNEELENRILNNLLHIDNLTLIYITHRNKENLFKKQLQLRKDGTYDFREQ